uniref:Female-specific orf protein n=1 Tax=Lemiox rimosus TaxID=301913 RepID=F4ZFH4_LEMRI|nr:female-specific orf protein [Lemiox rimosus]
MPIKCFILHIDFSRQKSTLVHLATKLTLVIKMKTWITNMPNHKMKKLIIISATSLMLMILLLIPFYSTPEKISYTSLLLTDNQLENKQPSDTPTTPTGCHPIKNSPASTNISDNT